MSLPPSLLDWTVPLAIRDAYPSVCLSWEANEVHALELIEKEKDNFDVIIIKPCYMTQGLCINIVRQIRKLGYQKPIIGWSIWEEEVVKRAFIQAGANAYVACNGLLQALLDEIKPFLV